MSEQQSEAQKDRIVDHFPVVPFRKERNGGIRDRQRRQVLLVEGRTEIPVVGHVEEAVVERRPKQERSLSAEVVLDAEADDHRRTHQRHLIFDGDILEFEFARLHIRHPLGTQHDLRVVPVEVRHLVVRGGPQVQAEAETEPVTGFMLIHALLSLHSGTFGSTDSQLILPSIVLATIPMAVIARQTRSAMLEVLGEDYIRTARAKGLPPARINAVHALRNSLIPVITVIGLSVGTLLAGAILTETIFSWPGIGKWMVDSIFRRDYPVVQGGLMLIAVMVMIVNLTVDVLYGVINPKIRKRS